MQQVGDVAPGQRREFRRLVEYGVARDERRHEDVAANEIRIVPRRDVRDDAERLLRDPLVEVLRRVGEYLLFAQRPRGFGDEEIETRDEALELVTRLADGLAHF